MLEAIEFTSVYSESDGFHDCQVIFGVDPPEGFELFTKAMLLKIAEAIPLRIFVQDPQSRLGEMIWLDEEFTSLKYEDGYIVWKRAELGLR